MESVGNILQETIKKLLQDPEKKEKSLLENSWKDIAGEKFYKITTAKILKEVLYVFAKDSVLAYEISQKYRPSLLKRAQAVMGEEKVKSVRVLVGK